MRWGWGDVQAEQKRTNTRLGINSWLSPVTKLDYPGESSSANSSTIVHQPLFSKLREREREREKATAVHELSYASARRIVKVDAYNRERVARMESTRESW